MDVLDAINENNILDEQNRATADVFIHKHIDEMLQLEYFNYDNPSILLKELKSRFNHQRDSLLPIARAKWNNLRFLDFIKVNDYTSALLNICSRLEFCKQIMTVGDMLEKTYSTFHALNIILQQQLWLQNFQTYYDMNKNLIIAEKNNELLMKNHQARSTGLLAIPEANIAYNNDHKNSGHKREQGRGRGHGHGRNYFNKTHFSGRNHSLKWNNNNNNNGRGHGRGHSQRANNYHANQQNKFKNDAGTSQNNGGSCFRCGSNNHWAKTCRTPSHLCELYQASLRGKEKEVNHIDKIDDIDIELNASDFINESDPESDIVKS
ncbi:uncharacterized protein LOC143599726 [Bidens hawaiensis]|uniref:uncharacterized protein LOC143599726 n=1 Tax=Bidens hawaiensis TaxID=980011 RepID=UPI00404A84A5